MTWPNPVFISTPFLKVFIKLVEDSCIFLLNYLVEFVPFCLYVNKCCTFCNTFESVLKSGFAKYLDVYDLAAYVCDVSHDGTRRQSHRSGMRTAGNGTRLCKSTGSLGCFLAQL